MVKLSEADEKRIAAKVEEMERITTGEIVVMALASSDTYPGARWRCAILFALLGAFATVLIFPLLSALWILWIQLPLLGVGYLLGSIPSVQRWFLLRAKTVEEVHQRAVQAFFANDIHVTSERSGVLIFVSMLEHQVEILADEGIQSRIQDLPVSPWESIVNRLTSEIKSEGLVEALLHAIESTGKVLTEHFPSTSGQPNRNELPNQRLT